MPTNQSKLHLDKLLSNVSRKYMNQEYHAMQVFPQVLVSKTTDQYRTYTRNWRIPHTERAPSALAREWDFDISNASFEIKKNSIKGYIADEEAMDDDLGTLRADMTEELTDVIHRKIEYDWAQLFTSTNWSQNVSLTSAQVWTAQTTASNPIPVIDTATSVIAANSGYMPNVMVMPRDSYVACKNHTSVLDRVKYTSIEIGPEILKGLFDLKGEMFIARASYDTSAEGVTDSIDYLFPNNYVFLGYKPSKATRFKPSCGYTFIRRVPGVKRWRVEERESEAIEVTVEFQPAVVSPLAGYLIKDTI